MNQPECGRVRELIPDFASGRLRDDGVVVVEHVSGCAECRAELALAQALYASRAEAPPELARRVIVAVRSRRAGHRPWWGVTAAAVAALALGIGMGSEAPSTVPGDVPEFAYETEEGEEWLADDGLVAGAPALEGLTDEALVQLLDEMVLTTAGGAV